MVMIYGVNGPFEVFLIWQLKEWRPVSGSTLSPGGVVHPYQLFNDFSKDYVCFSTLLVTPVRLRGIAAVPVKCVRGAFIQ